MYNNLNANNYKLIVNYQDTDAGGVVHHSSYLKFAEKARAHMLRVLFGKEFCKSYIWVVKNLQINYIKPAKLEDIIEIVTDISSIKNYSVNIIQKFYIENKLVTSMKLTMVSLDANFNFLFISNSIKEKLNIYKKEKQNNE